MGIFNLLKKSGGAKSKESENLVEYEGYVIRPEPRKQGSGFVTAGYISKTEEDGSVKEQHFIRADTHSDRDSASEHAIFKGKQIIDEFGERLFGKH